MSTITQSNATENQIFSAYDTSKIFLFDNKFREVTVTNSAGTDLAVVEGMAIGAVGATYQEYKSGTSNIQLIGVAAQAVTVPANGTATVVICTSGKIAEEKVVLNGSDTLDTIVSNKTIRDRFASDTLGIYFAATDELTVADNV